MSTRVVLPGAPPTRRETQVAIATLFGHSVKVTAAELRMAPGTVSCHRERLFTKYGVHGIGDLVRVLMSGAAG
jgi:DNA-binding NarL/FixJ family response regulator